MKMSLQFEKNLKNIFEERGFMSARELREVFASEKDK